MKSLTKDRNFKKNQIEILEFKNTIEEMNSSGENTNSKTGQAEKRICEPTGTLKQSHQRVTRKRG